MKGNSVIEWIEKYYPTISKSNWFSFHVILYHLFSFTFFHFISYLSHLISVSLLILPPFHYISITNKSQPILLLLQITLHILAHLLHFLQRLNVRIVYLLHRGENARNEPLHLIIPAETHSIFPLQFPHFLRIFSFFHLFPLYHF